MQPMVTLARIFDMQVCVPFWWTDEQVTIYANAANPAGTQNGWRMKRNGDPSLAGSKEKVPCSERSHCMHIMFQV